MNIKLAADENGKLLALWGNNYVDHGPYSEFGDLLTMRLSQFTGAGYGINSIRNKSTTVFTNHAWGSAFRAYGSPQSYMGSEIAIDVLAAKMGIDPFDIREMNCYKESEALPSRQVIHRRYIVRKICLRKHVHCMKRRKNVLPKRMQLLTER